MFISGLIPSMWQGIRLSFKQISYVQRYKHRECLSHDFYSMTRFSLSYHHLRYELWLQREVDAVCHTRDSSSQQGVTNYGNYWVAGAWATSASPIIHASNAQ